MVEATTTIVATNAALSASKIIVESVENWNSLITPEWVTRNSFDSMIRGGTVCGFQEHLRLERYAVTPILRNMCECTGAGTVFVAMVPSGLGKTTAAKQFFHQFKQHTQGIAICSQVSSTTKPYVHLMLSALGMNPINPPKGWLKCLINCLHNAGNDTPGRQPYLVLDDFGRTKEDAELIMALKSQARNTNAIIIVLTRTKEDADFLLSQNDLVSIIPLSDTYPDYRNLFPNGEWASMRWDITTYKMSARHQPRFAKKYTRDQIENAIDQHIGSLTPQQIDQLDPLALWRALDAILAPPPSWNVDPTATLSGEGLEVDGACTQCVIL